MFQLAFGMSAFQSGLLVLALFAGNLCMKTITSPVLRRFGFRSVLLVNGLITAALVFSFSSIAPQTPKLLVILLLFAHGLSRSMQFTSLNTLAFVDIPKSLLSSASSFYAVAQQMSRGMGVAVGAVTLRLAMGIHGVEAAIPGIRDFHLAFALVSIIAALAIVDCVGLEADAGIEVSGHRR
jgi:Na+/melibiose symporter-like transporter